MIFNATQQRKAWSLAKTSLLFSYEHGVLALEAAEISVKRRLYHVYDERVGKSVYSVIEQGRIDQTFSPNSEERRDFFEEAAGIISFKLRRKEKERQLEKAQENIRQIEAFLRKVQKNHQALKLQTKKADVYRTLHQINFALEKNIQLLKGQALHQRKDILEDEQKNLPKKRARLHNSQFQLEAMMQHNQELRRKIQLLKKDMASKPHLVISKCNEIKTQKNELTQAKFQIEKKQIALTQVSTSSLSFYEHFQNNHSVGFLSCQNHVYHLTETKVFYQERYVKQEIFIGVILSMRF